ncbi:putative membrane protein, partial [Escherichia coli 99.0672]
MPDTSA